MINELPEREHCDNPDCEDHYGMGEFTCLSSIGIRQPCPKCDGTGFLPLDRKALLDLVRRNQDKLLRNARLYNRPPRDIVELMDIADKLDELQATDPELDAKLDQIADQIARMSDTNNPNEQDD